MNPLWYIQLLGGLRASRTGGPSPRVITRFGRHKAGALLAYLAFYGHRAHAREEMVELWWPDALPKDARNNLSVCLSSLRHQLEPPGVSFGAVLQADRLTVRLNPEAVSTDVAAFRAALEAADRAPATERLRLLQEAVDGYGGSLLPAYYDDWVLGEQERLSEQFFESVLRLAALLERAGDRQQAIRVSRRALSLDPPRIEAHDRREKVQENLLRLLGETGEPEAAPGASPVLRPRKPPRRACRPRLQRFSGAPRRWPGWRRCSKRPIRAW
jgi:DNA-binding SARP family transcriptional activator